jgi:phosphoadenosine phosphosulfate reductase
MINSERNNINNFVNANKNRLNLLLRSEALDDEQFPIGAEPFIYQQIKKFNNRTPVVSFSGGKDSIVVSHLVRNTLNKQSVIHLFGDTTLEQPTTYQFLQEFMSQNESTPFFIERNDNSDFMDMCEQIGPPSRVKSWCCSVFKTGPMGTTLSQMDMNILTFYGIRRSESLSRSKYKRVVHSPKLQKQIVASPIIDWLDIDIWLYILTENIPFNIAYRQGFSRVGCWCCPNNSEWSDMLSRLYYPDQYKNGTNSF